MEERQAKRNRKTLPSAAPASIPTVSDADHRVYDPVQVPDRPKVISEKVRFEEVKSELLPDEKIPDSLKEVFRYPGYPKVIALYNSDPNRCEFHKERTGWWIQIKNLPEDDLQMIVHLRCDCGAEGCVRWYNDGFARWSQEKLVSIINQNVTYYGTRCQCGSRVSYCLIDRRLAKRKRVLIQMGKTLPSADRNSTDADDHPGFNFTASDLALFKHIYHVNLILLLEGKLDASQYDKKDRNKPKFNRNAVFNDGDYPQVIPLNKHAPDCFEFEKKRIGWWIQKTELPEDDLRMVVHLDCECGAKGCVCWYNDGGFAWSQDELRAVISRKFAYFGTLCFCGSHSSWCAIRREPVTANEQMEAEIEAETETETEGEETETEGETETETEGEEIIEAETETEGIQTPKILPSSLGGHPAFNFTASDIGLFQKFYFYNLMLLFEGVIHRSRYNKIVDPDCHILTKYFIEPHPNPNAVFHYGDYPKVITLRRLALDRSEFHTETYGWWIDKEEDIDLRLREDDLKMVVQMVCCCGAEGRVNWYKDGRCSWRKDQISAVLSRKVAYFATSCMCGSTVPHCGIQLDKSIDEFLVAGGS
ncbi:hypothetical protein CCACVL1_11259 [Corchorus capsularis]|uniref:Uncharacterized protein n=1 Tax=Corchorus capsularis TaxID=210143 RepID=A0A1R3IMC6_COCAP|nr:hypothetical protein CCACVL1_11259 [Corchorus capsularis]